MSAISMIRGSCGRVCLLCCGIILPTVIVTIGLWLSVHYGTLPHPAGYATVGMIIGSMLLLWAVVDRGRDLGQHPLQTLGEWGVFAVLGYMVLHFTETGERLVYYALLHPYISITVSIVVQHYYLIYLLLMSKGMRSQ